MRKRKQVDPFRLVILDDERKEFSIEGPMTSDRAWVNAICAAQQEGRKLHCTTASLDNPETYVRRYWQEQGYQEAENSIVRPEN